MNAMISTELFFVVAEPDDSIEWALGFEAFQRCKGPGKGASRSHGWLAARAEVQEELVTRTSERYEIDFTRFGC